MQEFALIDEFVREADGLARQRLRIGCMFIAVLNELFIPVYYFMYPWERFIPLLALAAAIVGVSSAVFSLSYNKRIPPYPLMCAGITLNVWLQIMIVMTTGGSRSPFFPEVLMYIVGTSALHPGRMKYPLTIFGITFASYAVAVLVFDRNINYGLLAVNNVAIISSASMGITGMYLWDVLRRSEWDKRLMYHKERDNICRCLHDSLSDDLYNVILLSERAGSKCVHGGKAGRELSLIAETSRRGLENIRDFLFSADREEASLDALAERIGDFGARTFGDSDTEFVFSQHISNKPFSPSPLHIFNLYLICKEAIANIAKYAKARKVTVTVSCCDGRLEIGIEDDGTGFDIRGVPHSCNGLKNMRKRAGEIGGALDIASSPGKGTRVKLDLVLK